MSLEAMTWATGQRGLKTGVWKVLVKLANRHNTDLRYCFPDQEKLADDCEISRASLNRHLLELEEAGLVCRVPHKDPVTRLQLNTRYYLSFDTDFKTLDVVGRVSNCDTDIRVSNSAKSVSHSSETLITSKITSKKPLTPSQGGSAQPQDVEPSIHVNGLLDEDLYRACCALSGHKPAMLDGRGGWTFSQSIIDAARVRLGSAGA